MKINVADLLSVECLLLLGSYQVTASEDILKYEHKHRTHKAVEKANGLWCHRCYTMDVNKEYCMNVTRNDSSLHHKCEGDMKTCMVKRVSYSTTSTNASANVHKVWSLERNCTHKCEPGCIIIGERIKLYQCTSCCEGKNFCNGGSGSSTLKPSPAFTSILFYTLLLLKHRISTPRTLFTQELNEYTSTFG